MPSPTQAPSERFWQNADCALWRQPLRWTMLLSMAALPLAAASAEAPTPAAAPVWGLHTLSLHSQPGFDDRNFGLYYRWSNGVTVGAFNNSYGKTSAYAGWLWRIDRAGHFGVFLGGATGYGSTEENLPVAPIFAPTMRWQLDNKAALRLSWFADPREGSAQVLHLSFELKR